MKVHNTTDNIDLENKDDCTWVENLDSRKELATQYAEFEKSLGWRKSLSKYRTAVLWVLYGQLVVFGYGIDGIIASNLLAIPRFRQDYGERFVVDGQEAYIISATWISAFAGVAQLTAIVGAMGTGWLVDNIGRRYTCAMSCVISVAGVALQFFSRGSIGILCAGKAVNGFPVGAWLVLGPLYASEVAPIALRGWLTAVTNFIQFCGVLLFTGIMYELGPMDEKLSYEVPFACQWIIPGLILLTFWFWPESPTYLVRKGNMPAARRAAERLYGSKGKIDIDGYLAQIEESVSREHALSDEKDSKSYLECFSKDHRHRTLICVFVYSCQYLSGLVFILGYQSYYYQLIGYSTKMSFLLGMLNNSSQFIANICSWFLMTKLGRRPLIVWGQLIGAVCLFIVAGTSIIGTRDGYLATVAFIFIWSFTYQLTLGTVAWTVVGEIPALRLRARTQGLSNLALCFTQWLIGFTFPYMFNPDAGDLGGRVGFVFGTTTFIGFLGVFFFLPETKGLSVREIDEVFTSISNHGGLVRFSPLR